MSDPKKPPVKYDWGVGAAPGPQTGKRQKWVIWISRDDTVETLATFRSKKTLDAFIEMAGGMLATGIHPNRLNQAVDSFLDG